MPPWHIDRNVGIQEFKNDLSLSDKDIATIVAWVDGGAQRGNPADMPTQRQFADGDDGPSASRISIVQFPAYKVPTSGPDLFPNLTAPTGPTEDRYIKAIQTRPIDLKSTKRRAPCDYHDALRRTPDDPAANPSIGPDGADRNSSSSTHRARRPRYTPRIPACC